MIRKTAEWIIRRRYLVLCILGVISLFFIREIGKIKIESRFTDLLPKNHPYIKIHNQYKDLLGDPLKVFLMFKVKEGDIYNQQTLEKVKKITDKLDAIPGVNHNQIYSIASRKIKKITTTSCGITTENFMTDVPKAQEEMDQFKETVRNTSAVYGVWVSPNEKSILFTAAFIPELVDYNIVFKKIDELTKSESDANHVIYATGEPLLIGWVYHYQKEMFRIFIITFLAIIGLLYFYFRNLVGVVVPMLSGILGTIWGLGFCGFLGYNLEPLTLVIPLLIVARGLSHAVQITERYFECYEELGEVKAACVEAATSILPPGFLGILADVIGIFLIAVAPIPLMQKTAILCGFWAFSLFFTSLIFTPVIISFFTPSKNISDIVDMNKGKTQKMLGHVAKFGFGWGGRITFVVGIILFGVTGWISSKVNLGDIYPGTPILWQDSYYNSSVAQLNKNFPGMDELYVIVEGKEKRDVTSPVFLFLLDSFQRHMEQHAGAAATLSLEDLLVPINRAIYGGFAKWEYLPENRDQIYQLYYTLGGNSAPGDNDRFVSRDERVANIIVWYKDHMGDTVRGAVSAAQNFIDENKDLLSKNGIKFQLASGNLGVLAAVNETVRDSQLLNYILLMASIFVCCALTYRSVMAAIILMIPLNLANLVTLTVMYFLGIGLNVNTLPVVGVGVGTGIDYGIYLLSRLCEEYQKTGAYSFNTLSLSLRTTGKAIFFTSTTMTAGVIFFYFLSSLRFQAEMGLLLAIILFINMVGALVLIPSLVYVFKPKFLGKVKLLIK